MPNNSFRILRRATIPTRERGTNPRCGIFFTAPASRLRPSCHPHLHQQCARCLSQSNEQSPKRDSTRAQAGDKLQDADGECGTYRCRVLSDCFPREENNIPTTGRSRTSVKTKEWLARAQGGRSRWRPSKLNSQSQSWIGWPPSIAFLFDCFDKKSSMSHAPYHRHRH